MVSNEILSQKKGKKLLRKHNSPKIAENLQTFYRRMTLIINIEHAIYINIGIDNYNIVKAHFSDMLHILGNYLREIYP